MSEDLVSKLFFRIQEVNNSTTLQEISQEIDGLIQNNVINDDRDLFILYNTMTNKGNELAILDVLSHLSSKAMVSDGIPKGTLKH